MALAVCRTLEQENLLTNVRERGEQLRAGLKAVADKYPGVVAEVRGWGLITGLVLNPDSDLVASTVVKAASEEGLLLVPAGPKVIRFVPPLIVSPEEIAQAVAVIDRALAAVA